MTARQAIHRIGDAQNGRHGDAYAGRAGDALKGRAGVPAFGEEDAA